MPAKRKPQARRSKAPRAEPKSRTTSANKRSREKSRAGSSQTPRQRALALKVAGQMRRGKKWTVALRAVGTTARTVRKGADDLFYRDRSRRVQVKRSDRKRVRLNVLTDDGYTEATARGSKERKVAGEHRNTVLKILRGELPETELERFRNQKVGGQQLLFDPAQLREVGIILEVQPERELYADLDAGGAR